MKTTPDAMELEKYIVKDAAADAPQEALQVLFEESKAGVPTAIAHHPELGWFVIQTSGQGPYIIWPTEPVPEQTRPETGPMRFGDDWRGIFIRGDSAIHYWMALDGCIQAQNREPRSFERVLQIDQLEGLRDLLYSAIQNQLSNTPPITPDSAVQHMKPFKIAKVSDPMTAYEQLVQTEPTAIVSQEEYNEISKAEHPEDYFVCGYQFGSFITFIRIGKEILRVPHSWFEGAQVEPDFDKFQITDTGQTVKLGDYEADVSAIIHDLEGK